MVQIRGPIPSHGMHMRQDGSGRHGGEWWRGETVGAPPRSGGRRTAGEACFDGKVEEGRLRTVVFQPAVEGVTHGCAIGRVVTASLSLPEKIK